jgi:DNA replication protein
VEYLEVVAEIQRRANDPSIGTDPQPIDDGRCPVCRGSGWEFVSNDPRTVRPCSHCRGGHADKVAEALARADIPADISLSAFDWSAYGTDTARAEKVVRTFVERFPDFEARRLGLFITSRTRGSGKTFLAKGVGKELIDRCELSVRFVSASELLEISKSRSENNFDPLADLIDCRLLILDDLGQKLTGRDWMADVLFRVLDGRYRAGKSLVVTSNVPLQELDLDDRLVDRLNAMTLTVKLPEVCIRAREANSRKLEILRQLGLEE